MNGPNSSPNQKSPRWSTRMDSMSKSLPVSTRPAEPSFTIGNETCPSGSLSSTHPSTAMAPLPP
jgi:hypothetical protein